MKKNDFDKNFKRAKTGAAITFIISVIVSVALIAGITFLVVKGALAIRERGMKIIIEEIWEGPDNN